MMQTQETMMDVLQLAKLSLAMYVKGFPQYVLEAVEILFSQKQTLMSNVTMEISTHLMDAQKLVKQNEGIFVLEFLRNAVLFVAMGCLKVMKLVMI